MNKFQKMCAGLLTLCLMLGALPGLAGADVAPYVLEYGQSYTLSWALDSGSEDRTVGFYGTYIEKNGRMDKVSVDVDQPGAKGSVSITPQTGGLYYFFGNVGDEGPVSYAVQVKNGPEEGNFRAALTLDRAQARPGDSLKAGASLLEGRQPYGPLTFSWWVKDSQGRDSKFHEESGPESTARVPEGIQGWVEVHAKDAAGRNAIARADFIIGEGELPQVAFALDTTTVPSGKAVTARWQVSGGQPPYQENIVWILKASGDGLSMYGQREDGPGTSSFAPDEPGFGSAFLEVTDAAGRKVISPTLGFLAIDAYGGLPLPYMLDQNDQPNYPMLLDNALKVTATASHTAARPGDKVTVDYVITGGIPPYQSIFQWINRDSMLEESFFEGDKGQASFVIPQEMAGQLRFEIRVLDQQPTEDIFVFTSEDLGMDIPLSKETPSTSGPIDNTHGRYLHDESYLNPLWMDLVFTPAQAGPGDTVVISWKLEGGVGTYRVITHWYLNGESQGESYSEGNPGEAHFEVKPGMQGALTVGFFIVDDQPTDEYYGFNPEELGLSVQISPEQGFSPQGGPAQPPNQAATAAVLNQRMATRSGPGTKYTEELGTLPKTTAITLIESVTTDGTPWGLVEFTMNGKLYRAYTGMKRIDPQGPVARGSEDYSRHSLVRASDSYYGPGYEYARRKSTVKAGTEIRILKTENGFWFCDYKVGKSWVRAYLPVQ